MWDLLIHPFSGPSIHTSTPPCVHLLRGSASLLTHRSVSYSDTICNNSSPPPDKLSSLSFPFQTSPQTFLKCLLGREFHTFTKKMFSSLPKRRRISQKCNCSTNLVFIHPKPSQPEPYGLSWIGRKKKKKKKNS